MNLREKITSNRCYWRLIDSSSTREREKKSRFSCCRLSSLIKHKMIMPSSIRSDIYFSSLVRSYNCCNSHIVWELTVSLSLSLSLYICWSQSLSSLLIMTTRFIRSTMQQIDCRQTDEKKASSLLRYLADVCVYIPMLSNRARKEDDEETPTCEIRKSSSK